MTDRRPTDSIGEQLRTLAPRVLSVLVRRYGNFADCEDAVSEAIVQALSAWPARGAPEHPMAWLVTAASRRLIDDVRASEARRRREAAVAPTEAVTDETDAVDDSLTLLFLCCHPALTPPSQIALTLRAVGGLTTAQIAAAFLVPEATMAQRISRAKQLIRDAGAQFLPPESTARPARTRAVLHVLYLIFNEGYATSSGADLTAPHLSAEAIRLARLARRLSPDDAEAAGLLALMLLTDARRAARTGPGGVLIPLDAQDRTRWDPSAIAEGTALLTEVLPNGLLGPYQLQAAIAAIHDEAPSVDQTDWPQVLALYDLLDRLAPCPMVTLNRAVAVAMVSGPTAGLALVDALATDDRMASHHRLLATRAHLLDRAGDPSGAVAAFRAAAARTASQPERLYLTARAQASEAQSKDFDRTRRER